MDQVVAVFCVPVITGAENVTGRLVRAPTAKWVPTVTAATCAQTMCRDQNVLGVSQATGGCQKMVAKVAMNHDHCHSWLPTFDLR